MLSKSFEKYANSLKQKKQRMGLRRFIAEGEKSCTELLHSNLKIEKIVALPEWIAANESLLKKHESIIVSASELEIKRISSLSTPSPVLLVAEIPSGKIDKQVVNENLNLVLDNIRDPGNMGTIIRIADWFGIPYIFCTPDSVDIYNPKVIQATMGSIARVRVFEMNIAELFDEFPSLTRYGADVKGENIFQLTLSNKGFIVIGNESHGISSNLASFIEQKISIPKTGNAESLNAAVATAIICAEFTRRMQ
jgi:TrmH family RNA methyltransferase